MDKKKRVREIDEIIICSKCKKKINFTKSKYVLLGTYDKIKPLNESYFHFKCFMAWYNQKVGEKAQNLVLDMQKKAIGLLNDKINDFGGVEAIQEALKQFQS